MMLHRSWPDCNPISRDAVLQKLKELGDRAGDFGDAARAAHEVLGAALKAAPPESLGCCPRCGPGVPLDYESGSCVSCGYHRQCDSCGNLIDPKPFGQLCFACAMIEENDQ